MTARINPGKHELTVKRSVFIAISRQIETRADVKPFIDGLKSEHPEARHVCYAFIADEKGDDFGYDDNGEPGGTAGKPIYSALAASGAVKSLIAVVRYFGGIKLGAGGLTRAYRQSAAELIENVGLVTVEKYTVYGISAEGDAFKRICTICKSQGYAVEQIRYGSDVSCTVKVPIAAERDFTDTVSAFCKTSDRRGEIYLPSDRKM